MNRKVIGGVQLEQWLEEQGTGKGELTSYIGVARSTVTRWVNGVTTPGGESLGLLALALFGQTVRTTARPSLEPVVDVLELVDWVGLYDYKVDDLRESVRTVKRKYGISCPLLVELENLSLTPLVSPEAQGIELPMVYVSRDEEVKQIQKFLRTMKAFREPLHTHLVLWGMGGIGKTILAKSIALNKSIREHFRDGVLWAELGPEPKQAKQKAAYWLQQWVNLLNLDIPKDATLWEQQAEIRKRLDSPECRLLIILDDVWWLEDVEPLLVGGPQTQVLLTTRNQAVAAHLPNCELLDVCGLSLAESRALLYKWSGIERQHKDHDGKYATELSQILESNPLALSLLGSLVKRRGWPYILERIRSHHRRLDALSTSVSATRHASVRMAIEVSYNTLPERLQYCFRQLGVFHYGNDFAATPLVNLWNISDVERGVGEMLAHATDTLFELYDRALLILTRREGEIGRFRLHTLLHDYAREQLHQENEWKQVQERFVNIYTFLAHELSQELVKHSRATEIEWANLTAAFVTACELGLYSEAALQLSRNTRYLLSMGRIRELDRWYERIRPHLNNIAVSVLGELEFSRAQRYMAVKNWRAVQRINARVLANPELAQDVRLFALYNEGKARLELGDREGAIDVHRQAMELGEKLESSAARAQVSMLQASIAEMQENIEATRIEWQQLAERSIAESSFAQTALALLEVARLLVDVHKHQAAQQRLEVALLLAVESGSLALEYGILIQMGELKLFLGHFADTDLIGRRILTLLKGMAFEERERSIREAYTKRMLASSAFEQRKVEQALALVEEAIHLFENGQADPDSLAIAYQLLAQVSFVRGEIDKSIEAYRQAEDSFRLAGMEQEAVSMSKARQELQKNRPRCH